MARDRKTKIGGWGGGEAEGGGRGARAVPNESKCDELKQSTGTIRLLLWRPQRGLSLAGCCSAPPPEPGQRPTGCHPGRGHLETRLGRQLQLSAGLLREAAINASAALSVSHWLSCGKKGKADFCCLSHHPLHPFRRFA